MKKLIKILGILIVVAFAALVAGAIALTVFFDPNDYKDEIASYVRDQTGREFDIRGDLSLSVFPWIGIEVGRTELGNAPGFGKDPFARTEEIGIRVKLLPLLSKELVMDTVVVEGLELHLVRTADGRTNWQDLAAVAAAGQKREAPAPKKEGGGLRRLDVSGVRVRDSRVIWDDRQSGTRIALEDMALSTGRLGGTEPVELALGFDVTGLGGMERERFELEATTLLDARAQQLDVDALELGFAGIEARGQLQGRSLGEAPRFDGQLTIEEFAPKELMRRLGLEPPATRDSSVLSEARLETRFEATTASAGLKDLKAWLDDTRLEGSAGVDGFDRPAIEFDLQVDRIDVDRYLPEASGEAGEQKAPKPEAALLPFAMLQQVNANGSLKIGELKAFNIRSQDVSMTVSSKNGRLRVYPASAQLYEGTYNGDIRIDAVKGQTPVLAMDEKLTGVQAGPLLKDLAGQERITGTAEISARLKASGHDTDALRKSLNGLVTFTFRDGAVKGINIAQMLRSANAALRGQPQPPKAQQQTDFASITGTANVRDGVVRNRDLEAKTPLLRVEGKGDIDLVREQLDYELTTVVVGSLEGQGGAGLEQLKGVPVPLTIKGPFAQPKIGVDLAKALTAKQKQRLDEKKEELEERAREKVEDKLKDFLKKR